eukprot:m.451794 g.451794  ORF g.451794 m.451794 type:complete len:462 (-) comp21532_c3_seq6:162-1547(-)
MAVYRSHLHQLACCTCILLMNAVGSLSQTPEIQANGMDLVLQPGSGGVVQVGGTAAGDCNSTGLCGLLSSVQQLQDALATAQSTIASMNQTILSLNATLASMTPSQIHSAHGFTRQSGTYDPTDPNTGIPLGAIHVTDYLEYTITLEGCRGGRSFEKGVINTEMIFNESVLPYTWQLIPTGSLHAQVTSLVQRNQYNHLISLYAMNITGTNRVMIYLVPGDDCIFGAMAGNTTGDGVLNTTCDRPCNTTSPRWSATFQSIGGFSGSDFFISDPDELATLRPPTWNINNSNVTRREYTETLQGVTTGGSLIGNSSIIPLGLMSTHDVLKMDFSLRDCGANGGMQVTFISRQLRAVDEGRAEAYVISAKNAADEIPLLVDNVNFFVKYAHVLRDVIPLFLPVHIDKVSSAQFIQWVECNVHDLGDCAFGGSIRLADFVTGERGIFCVIEICWEIVYVSPQQIV